MLKRTVYIKNLLSGTFEILFFLLLCASHVMAQPNFNTDSMLKNGVLISTSPYLDSLIKSLDEIEDDARRMETLYVICDHSVSENADKCIDYGKKCLRLAEKLGNLSKQRTLCLWLGVSYDDKGEYSNAIEMYGKSLEILNQLKQSSLEKTDNLFAKEAILANNIGYAYFNIGKYDEALKNYLNGLAIANEHSPKSSSTILGSISELYYKIGDLKKAEDYNRQSLNFAIDTFDLAVGYRMMGDIFEFRHMLDSSLYYYHLSFDHAKGQHDNYLMGMSVEGLVNYHLARNNFEKVIYVATYGLAVAEALNGKVQIISSHLALAKANGALGRHELALTHAHKALSVSVEANSITTLPACYEVLENCHLMENDIEKAYYYQKQLQAVKDTIFNSEKLRYLAEAESLNKLQLKEKENILLKDKQIINEALLQQKSAFNLAMLSLLTMSIVLAFFLYKNIRVKKHYNQQLEREVDKRTAALTNSNIELERFNQIVSHDLKGPLRNIVSFSSLSLRCLKKVDNPDLKDYISFIKKAAEQLNTLVEDVREFTRVDRKLPEQKPVDLNNLLENVIESLGQKIYEKKAEVFSSTELPIIQSHHGLLFVLYKNLIENGLKYNESEKPEIEVGYLEKKSSHIFMVTDNGIGIPEGRGDEIFEMFKRLDHNKDYKGTGMGLAICKKIVEKLGGDIHVASSSQEGTSFQIVIPKEQLEPII